MEEKFNRWIEMMKPFLIKIPQIAITATSFSTLILLIILNPSETISMIPFILFLGFYWIKMGIKWRKS